MLILTRKIDQAILIGLDIRVVVLGVERDRVKIGIEADRHIGVLREELADRAWAEALAAEEAEALQPPTPIRSKKETA